ncbi:hypothetical protein D3C85_1812140 [compost metagenome]
MMSNTLKLPIMEMRILIVKDGAINGKVIWTNLFHLLAPSMSAASYISAGMACKPAK